VMPLLYSVPLSCREIPPSINRSFIIIMGLCCHSAIVQVPNFDSYITNIHFFSSIGTTSFFIPLLCFLGKCPILFVASMWAGTKNRWLNFMF
jgi:hypothetical protein